jgi:hypothetical protein
MSRKELVATDADRAIAKKSAHYFCAVKFQTNRKANFQSVLKLCRRKAEVIEAPLDAKTSAYVVLFASNHAMIKLAAAVIDEIRTENWKFTVFAGGRITARYLVTNLINCYLQAKQCRNHKSHCTIVDVPFTEDDTRLKLNLDKSGDPVLDEEWLIPCRHMNHLLRLKRSDPIPPAERFEAAAIEAGVTICPFFTSEGFAPIKKIAKAKRFW